MKYQFQSEVMTPNQNQMFQNLLTSYIEIWTYPKNTKLYDSKYLAMFPNGHPTKDFFNPLYRLQVVKGVVNHTEKPQKCVTTPTSAQKSQSFLLW